MWIHVVVLLLLCGLLLAGKRNMMSNKRMPEKENFSGHVKRQEDIGGIAVKRNSWEKAGKLIVLMLEGIKRKQRFNKKRRYYESGQLDSYMQALYPGENPAVYIEGFRIKRFAMVLRIVFAANLLGIAAGIAGGTVAVLSEGNYLSRRPYGEGRRTEELLMEVPELALSEAMKITVEEQELSEEQGKELLAEAAEKLPELILGKDRSEHYNQSLALPIMYPDTPIKINWNIEPEGYMERDGSLTAEIPEEGVDLALHAGLVWKEHKESVCIQLRAYPEILESGEEVAAMVRERVRQSEKETDQEYLELPDTAGGFQVVWREKPVRTGLYMLCLGVLAAVLVYKGRDYELKKRMDTRKQQLMSDYPDILDKMTLYLGAGMPVRGAWEEIVRVYLREKDKSGKVQYGYEEMKVSLLRMRSGMPELEAYERFGRACGIPQYMKLGSMLTQNLRKGAAGLAELFEAEGQAAFEERKQRAKQLGEEAGTKLLIPMILMLGIVLMLIMIPAMLSFQA